MIVALQLEKLQKIRGFTKWLAISSIVAIFSLLLAYLIIDASFHDKINKRIFAALASQYSPATVDVVERKNFYHGGARRYFSFRTNYTFGAQICFDIEVLGSSGQQERKVVMVVVGEGGKLRFIREYPSLKRCENEFHRG